MPTLVIKNIGQLATATGSSALAGADQGRISRLDNAYILCTDHLITAIGQGPAPAADQVVDAGGQLVTAGLVDAHTHLVFGGWRQHELALKLKGVPYLDILAQGGGILSSVRATRAATEEELIAKTQPVLAEMLRLGVTTCEAKSGYGLSLEEEMKLLRVARQLNDSQPVDIVSTFMAAHAVPEEYRGQREAYIDLVISMLPAVADSGLAEFCDVFCEQGVFSAAESRRILRAGQELGLGAKLHADEIEPLGGSQLAGELGAISAEHLIVCPDQGIAAMAEAGVVACLLPGTSFYLGASFARAREMVAAGVPVACASDFNPGSCPSLNLQLVMNLACLKYRLTPEEALTAVTLNAAAAVGRAAQIGSLEAGKRADIVIWRAPDLEYIFYRWGSNLAAAVIKNGQLAAK